MRHTTIYCKQTFFCRTVIPRIKVSESAGDHHDDPTPRHPITTIYRRVVQYRVWRVCVYDNTSIIRRPPCYLRVNVSILSLNTVCSSITMFRTLLWCIPRDGSGVRDSGRGGFECLNCTKVFEEAEVCDVSFKNVGLVSLQIMTLISIYLHVSCFHRINDWICDKIYIRSWFDEKQQKFVRCNIIFNTWALLLFNLLR